ncbi:hypothetical protein ACKGJO_00085 [Gracilimonas sp. Q87]|uniref:hypothetical protein n=1 Tax=Gracilimonas sp. Q87 TaxID=3384766 RepID=UPI003983F6F3
MEKKITNICFIDNGFKTSFYQEVAREINSITNIFWIVVTLEKYNELVSIYSKENVLLINNEINESKELVELKYFEIIRNDRHFKFNENDSLIYLKSIQEPVFNFIKKNSISHVFGELTHGYELVIYLLIKIKFRGHCRYLNPHTIRIPDNRFAFFSDLKQSKFYSNKHNKKYDEVFIKSLFSIKKPDYFYRNNLKIKEQKRILTRLARIKRFFTSENIQKDNPRMIKIKNIVDRIRRPITEEINRFAYNFIKTNSMNDLKGKEYFYYPLHKQPEASIDVLGVYYNNQLELVKSIVQLLPINHFLVVKEHPNAIGDRGFRFYRNLKNDPRIIFVNEKCDSHEIIKYSDVVFTVSGTVAYEAALMGVESFTFSETFFNKLKHCHKVSYEDFRNHYNFNHFLKKFKKMNENKMNIYEFGNYILNNSFNGNISDPVTNYDSISKDNIENVSKAFLEIIHD